MYIPGQEIAEDLRKQASDLWERLEKHQDNILYVILAGSKKGSTVGGTHTSPTSLGKRDWCVELEGYTEMRRRVRTYLGVNSITDLKLTTGSLTRGFSYEFNGVQTVTSTLTSPSILISQNPRLLSILFQSRTFR